MSHSPIKLLCTDFDGTLFDHLSQPCIPKPLLEAIQRLQQRGCLWMVNTGREKSYLLESLLP
ncbi:MAG: HAD hydrolase family protein, partial [Verrucomicrobiales bacterium]